MEEHNFPPIYDKNSKILILGSFPSVKSRETQFYYAHPQNRFWKVLQQLFEEKISNNPLDKTNFLLTHRIALWDVIAKCDIIGSSDSSIQNLAPNDINIILRSAPIAKIFVNGSTAKKIYDKYIFPSLAYDATVLPSTSPANARYTLEALLDSWKIIKQYL